MMGARPHISVAQAAYLTGASRSTIYRWVRVGRVSSFIDPAFKRRLMLVSVGGVLEVAEADGYIAWRSLERHRRFEYPFCLGCWYGRLGDHVAGSERPLHDYCPGCNQTHELRQFGTLKPRGTLMILCRRAQRRVRPAGPHSEPAPT